MNGLFESGQAVLGSWTIVKKLGEGSFGKVFEITREDFGQQYKAALKVITVPQSEAELRGVLEEGMDLRSAEKYFYTMVEDIVREFALMARLKGTANIVGYEDHTVVKHQSGIGWDILIRMELLTPLLTFAYVHPFSRRDIIRLGIDMCRALELCQRYNIIHRDIKPENIFISDNGDFKLGDFGIARTIEKTISALSKKGTYNYMAPEVYRGEEYGFNVDTYSLGIVLYRLLNRNRIPFMPPAPQPITFSNREAALAKRMAGTAIPSACYAEGRLAEIIARAIAFDPKERYSSPMQMRGELEAIVYDEADAVIIYPDGDELALVENEYLSGTPDEAGFGASHDISDGGTDRTLSVISQAEEAPSLEDATSSTVSILSGSSGETSHDWTVSRTESLFGKACGGQAHTGSEDKPPPVKPERKLKALKFVIPTLVLVIGIVAGILFNENDKQQREQQQQQEEQQRVSRYVSLMSQASALYDNDPEQAAILLLEAQELFPDEAEPHIGYSYALFRAGNYDECIRYIEDDLSLGKKYDIADQSRLSEILGAAYFEKAEYAAAASFFRLSSAGGDITASTMRYFAVSLGKLGDVDAASEVLQRMLYAGADAVETDYVRAEIDFTRQEYLDAERGFRGILNTPGADTGLQKRAFRSLAEVYRDCAVLEKLGSSPISGAARLQAELLAEGMTRFSLSYDSTIWEMLAQAYYDAHQANPGLGDSWLEQSAQAFYQVLNLGISREYIYNNLVTIYFALNDYARAGEMIDKMQERYPGSYTPHALRCMLLILTETSKPEPERDFSAAYAEYKVTESKIRSSDDTYYFQQVESFIKELKEKGWL